MFSRIAVRLSKFLLDKVNLSVSDRIILTNCILENLAAIPLHDIIKLTEDGTLIINGRAVDFETARNLRESARLALNNQALRLVNDQVIFIAMSEGTYKAETEAQVFFGKAAVWGEQQKFKYLKLIAAYEKNDMEPGQ